MELNSKSFLVSFNETVIQAGDRKGEVVRRASLSDCSTIVKDLTIRSDYEGIPFKDLKCMTEYNFVFDYSQKVYDGKAYNSFTIKGIYPVNK